MLGNQSHRESKKEVYKIICMSSNMTFEEYIEKIKEINNKIGKG